MLNYANQLVTNFICLLFNKGSLYKDNESFIFDNIYLWLLEKGVDELQNPLNNLTYC